MGILDSVDNDAGLALTMLILYTGESALSLSYLRRPLDLPPEGFYLVTCVPLLLYFFSRLFRGRLRYVWGNITVAVLLCSIFLVGAAIAPSQYTGEIRFPESSYFLVTGSPLIIYVVFRCVRWIARKRHQKQSANLQ